jgi:hypothetical protein
LFHLQHFHRMKNEANVKGGLITHRGLELKTRNSHYNNIGPSS